MARQRARTRSGTSKSAARTAPTRAADWRPILTFVCLALATLAVYSPVWHGGVLWDDDAHLTTESLRSFAGLGRIWMDPGATQQYYPVVNTAFWVMSQLWGSDTLGYHLVNILLHATSAFLVIVIARRLGIAGAIAAGAVFAVHPIYVESVAWMSELKNTLSGVFYLTSLLVYLRFHDTRARRDYAIALVCFVLALGSKTVTATLPAAIAVILWWRQGRLDWKKDLAPLVPFLVVGLVAGVGTAWLEVHWVGAQGREFSLGLGDRLLLAGRVVWFYAGTIVWPVHLSFNYARWTIDTSAAWQYVFPAALVSVLAGLVLWSRRNRGPLAGALFFIGSLTPALGFLNVYPFRYSYVADHFQYLASLGLIVPLIAWLATALRGRWPSLRPAVVAIAIGAPLAVMSYQYSQEYVSAEVLYRATLEKNPQSSLSHNNLAALLLDGPAAGWAEGIRHVQAVLAFKPDDPAAHNLLGLGYLKTERFEDASREQREAIRLDPQLEEARYNLGLSLTGLGRLDEAVQAYQDALKIFPNNARALHNLSHTLRQLKRFDEAVTYAREAVRISPDTPEVRTNLAEALQQAGRWDEAIAAYQDALRLQPEAGTNWNNLGLVLKRQGRTAEALEAFRHAAQLMPDVARVHANVASLLVANGQLEASLPEFAQAIAGTPGPQSASLHNDVGLVLLTLHRVPDAIAQFETAVRLQPDFAEARANLARAKSGGR